VALGGAFKWDQSYTVDVVGYEADGSREVITANSTHTREVVCEAGQLQCMGPTLAGFAHLYHPMYRVTARLTAPYQAFAGYPLDPNVNVAVVAGTIAKEYTAFELGWKYFFITVSCVFWVVYT
jgi:hypothetical protein